MALGGRRNLVRGLSLLLLLLAGPVLTACGEGGLRPLYGTTASGVGLEERFARVDFAPIPGRVGQRIRNELIFQSTNGTGKGLDPAFRFEVVVTETIASTLIRSDGNAGGQVYNVAATYRLINIKDKKVVWQGTSAARAGFERYDSIYSNVRAREDAENRAARVISDEIKTRLSAYLATSA